VSAPAVCCDEQVCVVIAHVPAGTLTLPMSAQFCGAEQLPACAGMVTDICWPPITSVEASVCAPVTQNEPSLPVTSEEDRKSTPSARRYWPAHAPLGSISLPRTHAVLNAWSAFQ
jgi:hypothetical protein